MSLPNRLANGAGNYPDAIKFNNNFDYVEALSNGNFLLGAGFETWTAGTSFTNPTHGTTLADNWTLEKGGTTGATANVARESSTIDTGSYSKKVDITGAGSANSYLRLKQSMVNPSRFKGLHVAFGMKIKAPAASKVRLSITDGVTTQYSSYHTGDGTWQKLLVRFTVSSSATELTVRVEITSDAVMAVYADSGFLFLVASEATDTAIQSLLFAGPGDPSVEGRLGAAESNITTLSGRIVGKNRVRNGAFAVNQRGATSVADAASHLDGWYALAESGNVTIAQMTDQENGAPTSLKMTQPDVTAKRIGSAQIIASLNCRDLRSKAVTLSGRLKCSAAQAVRFAIVEHTGTADAATVDPVNSWGSSTYTPSNFFIAGVTVVAVGSLTPSAATWTSFTLNGTLSGSVNNLYVIVWTEGTLAQNGTLELNRVQLEEGTSATPFDFKNARDDAQFADDFPQFLARAWVSFNGSGTPSISGSGNVTSLTDNGTGDWTINFTKDMQDANYACAALCGHSSTANFGILLLDSVLAGTTYSKTASGLRVFYVNNAGSLQDAEYINVVIFR